MIATVIHEILQVGVLKCNCSIFGDEESKEAIVIDPGADLDEIVAILDKHELKVKAIVITHAHIDHIGGAAKLRKMTGAPVWMNPADSLLAKGLALQAAWIGVKTPENPGIDVAAVDGESLLLGACQFHVMHTPGHSSGSISLFLPQEEKLVAGDTLFRDSIGRTDLPGGDSKKIIQSIQGTLFKLPDETVVIPGHGPTTTIGREKQFNPFVRV